MSNYVIILFVNVYRWALLPYRVYLCRLNNYIVEQVNVDPNYLYTNSRYHINFSSYQGMKAGFGMQDVKAFKSVHLHSFYHSHIIWFELSVSIRLGCFISEICITEFSLDRSYSSYLFWSSPHPPFDTLFRRQFPPPTTSHFYFYFK